MKARQVVVLALVVVGMPFLPLLISWRWGWWEAWVYAAIGVLGFFVSRTLAARRHPDLLSERARGLRQEDAKAWDKVLAPAVALGAGSIPLVAGLDARFGWSPSFGLPIKVLALVVILAGYALSSYALIENRFFSGAVRLQTDRGHRVVSSGPYRWVRHPGYAGGLLAHLATPVFLDAGWAFVPALVIAILTVVRTELEDKALQEQLEGYREYARRVRYRLLPGLW